jgi:hypothetical protein
LRPVPAPDHPHEVSKQCEPNTMLETDEPARPGSFSPKP